MKKLTLPLIALLLALPFPAMAQETALPDAALPLEGGTPRELMEILLPQESYLFEKKKLMEEVQKHLDTTFPCLGEDAKLHKEVADKLEDIFSYETMTAGMEELFSGLTEQDILYIRAFYTSDTGAKWAAIQTSMQEASRKAGKEMGENVGKDVLPMIAADAKCMKEAKEKAAAMQAEEKPEAEKK